MTQLSIGDLPEEERYQIYQYYVGWFAALCVILLLVRKVRNTGRADSKHRNPDRAIGRQLRQMMRMRSC
jgi:hypothetical protein